MTSIISNPMAWTNERLKLSCTDGIGLKTLWKMIVLDNQNSNSKKQQKHVSIFKVTKCNSVDISIFY